MKDDLDWIDEWKKSSAQAYRKMGGDLMQPLEFSEIDPYVAKEWTEKILKLIDLSEKKRLNPEKISKLLYNTSNARIMFLLTLFSAKIAGELREKRLKIAEMLNRIIATTALSDPYLFKSNIAHKAAEIESIKQKLRVTNPSKTKKLGQLVNALNNLRYAIYTDNFPQISGTTTGPYQVGTRSMIIREFDHLNPVDIWKGINEKIPKKIKVVYMFDKSVKVEIDSMTHVLIKGDFSKGLNKYYLEIDGKACDIENVDKTTQIIGEGAIKTWKQLTSLEFEELKQTYLLIKSYQVKGWCDELGVDWKPSKKMREKVKNRKLLKWPSSNNIDNSIKWYLNIIDPRIDLSLSDRILLWWVLSFSKRNY